MSVYKVFNSNNLTLLFYTIYLCFIFELGRDNKHNCGYFKQFCFIRSRRQPLWAIDYRGGIADLPLLRTLLAVRQKYQEPSSWEVMGSFVLLPHASSQLQEPICNDYWCNFNFSSKDLFCWYK